MLKMYDEHVNMKIALGLKKVSNVMINNDYGIGDSKVFKQLVRDEVNKRLREIRSRDNVIYSSRLPSPSHLSTKPSNSKSQLYKD